MDDAVELVQGLSSVQAVRLLQRLNKDLYSALPYAEVEQRALPDARTLLAVDARVRRETLDAESSAATARMLLTAMARDPSLAPLVLQAWNAIKDEHALMVETIVAVGLILNLTLFMSTTEMDLKVGNVKIRKKRADAKLLKELLAPVTELIKKYKPAS